MKTHFKPQLLLPLEQEETRSGLSRPSLPFWLCRVAPFPRPPPLKVFGFHRCRNVFRETFISKLPATGDRIGGHFTGLVRENRKRELHCKRMTFTCIFTFIHSCCRMEATPGDVSGKTRKVTATCMY